MDKTIPRACLFHDVGLLLADCIRNLNLAGELPRYAYTATGLVNF